MNSTIFFVMFIWFHFSYHTTNLCLCYYIPYTTTGLVLRTLKSTNSWLFSPLKPSTRHFDSSLSSYASKQSTTMSFSSRATPPPSTYSKVEKDCITSLTKYLSIVKQQATKIPQSRISIDVLTPGT